MASALHERKNSSPEAEVASLRLQSFTHAIPRRKDSFVLRDGAGGPTSPVDPWGFESWEQSGVPAH